MASSGSVASVSRSVPSSTTGFLGPPMGAVTVKARDSSSSEDGSDL